MAGMRRTGSYDQQDLAWLDSERSAMEVIRDLVPSCKPAVMARLSREGIRCAADLAGLDKEDLRELGFTMIERSRLLRWANSSSVGVALATQLELSTPTANMDHQRPIPHTLGDFIDVDTPLRTASVEEEEAQHRLDEVEQQADFWCSLVQPTTDRFRPASFEPFGRTNSLGEEEFEDLRENMLEGLFDLTSERVAQIYGRMQSKSHDNVVSSEAMRNGLHRCGIPDLDDKALAKVVEAVSRARPQSRNHAGGNGVPWRGIELAEFEAVLSRLKLAQLLTGACTMPLDRDTLGGRRQVLGHAHVNGHLTVTDYTPQHATVMHVEQTRFREFFFGHRKRPKTPGEQQPVRWVHMAGLDLTLLLALMVKYSLHPLGVEDVIEQCPTKVDKFGNHYFASVEQLCLASPLDGSEPVRVHGRHVAIFSSGPPLYDTILTVTEPDHDEKEDWPGGAMRDALGVGDLWVQRLRERLESQHSRLRERRADFLMHQILDLSSDELVKVTRAYTTRLSILDSQPHITAAGLQSEWLGEVSLAQQQLAVVIRRARGLQRLMRRVMEDVDLASGTHAYVGDVRDHIDEAHEDAVYLAEKCRTILESSERQLERHSNYCRQRADDRLNLMVFVLTVATAIFAPVQLMAGVYGMNFVDTAGTTTIPELLMPDGYAYFWFSTIMYLFIAGSFASVLFKRFKLKQQEDFNSLGDVNRAKCCALPAPKREPGAAEGGPPKPEPPGPAQAFLYEPSRSAAPWLESSNPIKGELGPAYDRPSGSPDRSARAGASAGTGSITSRSAASTGLRQPLLNVAGPVDDVSFGMQSRMEGAG